MLLFLSSSKVVPYIGTWIETPALLAFLHKESVVPYIGTWIETVIHYLSLYLYLSYLI